MTFLEAAIAVLRRAGGDLHVREIARRAVEEDLLSHVGRDPETAMRSCLTSAVRSGTERDGFRIVRTKPGHYAVEAVGAEPSAPSEGADRGGGGPAPEGGGSSTARKTDGKTRSSGEAAAGKEGEPPAGAKATDAPAASGADGSEDGGEDRRSGSTGAGTETPGAGGGATGSRALELAFHAPPEAGLDGVTDVALVMANAMSRLVAERPELREEFEAMQKARAEQETKVRAASGRGAGAPRGRAVEVPVAERPGRRRRRRRRKAKKVEWAAAFPEAEDLREAEARLLDTVAEVLAEAGSKQVHIRQLAEAVAARGLLGGDVSEIERSVTAALLSDIRTFGRLSRFVARGDARYQLQSARLPDAAAAAEDALKSALAKVHRDIEAHLAAWIGSLGVRALEAVTRLYLSSEGFSIVTALAPAKGVGRLVVEDPDGAGEEARTLVVVMPRKVGVDPRVWNGEKEKQGCSGLLLVAGGSWPESIEPPAEAKVVAAPDLAAWMRAGGFGVQTCTLQVTLLDPTVVESIAGLDT